MTIERTQVLSVLLVTLLFGGSFSGFLALGVGQASAATGLSDSQFQTSSGEEAVEQCVNNVDGWAAFLSPAYGAYQCIDGAFTPSEYDSSSELENEAYNNMVSLQDTTETRQNDWQNWNELSQTSALQQAEKPLVEAHYNGSSEGEARSDAQAALRQYYSAQLSTEYNTHDEVVERTVSVGTNTAEDDGTVPMVAFNRSFYTTYEESYQHNITENSSIVYQNVTLPNGNTQEVASAVRNLESSDGSNESIVAVFHDNTEVKNSTLNSGYYAYNETDDSYNQLQGTGIVLDVRDPYSDSLDTVAWWGQHENRVNAIENEYNDSQSELVTMAEDLYETHDTGTIDPSEYVSAATLTQEYASEDGHYSYSSALATTNGMRTDLESAQTIQYNGSEYEGQILVGGQGQPLADDTGAAYFSSESDSVLNFTSAGENETANVTLETETDVSVDAVHKVNSSGVSISDDGTSVTIDETAVNGEFVLFEINDSTGTNQTVVMYTSQDKADEGIPTGLQTGETYSASDFDGSVMMAYQQGDKAAVERIASGEFTLDNATNQATGEEMEYIEYDDANQRTFNATNLQEELEQTDRIQQAIEQRDDVSPAGSGGGMDDWQVGALGALGGAGLVIAFGGLILILFLVGRITSIA